MISPLLKKDAEIVYRLRRFCDFNTEMKDKG